MIGPPQQPQDRSGCGPQGSRGDGREDASPAPPPGGPGPWGRRRPPWWPEGEAWPPAGGWHSVRRRFVRRVALLLAGVFVLLFAVSAIWAAFGPRFGWQSGGSSGAHFIPWVPALFLIVIAALVIARTLRRAAAPIGDVMDAANRLASGDYTARVEARGSGEVRQLIDSFNAMAERLHASEGQRRALLAEVAHELRTPLSIMQGQVEGMLDGVYPRDDEHLEPVVAGTRRMTRLLEDLQTLSTAQAGALRLHREPTDARRLMQEVREAFAPRAAARGVAFTTAVDDLSQLDVDPVRLRQVLDNLVANALRFTPGGGSVTVIGRRDGAAALFSVRDTGSGIAPAQLPYLFERFTKSADSHGSGLGLAIAKSLVESHGGTISAQSEPGRGTTITFGIPLDRRE